VPGAKAGSKTALSTGDFTKPLDKGYKNRIGLYLEPESTLFAIDSCHAGFFPDERERVKQKKRRALTTCQHQLPLLFSWNCKSKVRCIGW
jgi:hypothetical protein